MSDEQTTQRVKIQIGTRSSTNEIAATNSESPPTSSSRVDIATGASDLPLAELVSSYYLSKKGKDRKSRITVPTKKSQPKSVLTKGKSNTSYDSNPAESGPRVEIIDGKIVIKESSLVISGQEIGGNEDYEEVEEGASSTSRYSSFTTKKPSRAWGIEETRIFYNALRQCGIDFSMLQSFFPSRTRKELKMKFRREESQHPELISQALNATLPLDISPFELQLGTKLNVLDEER